MQFQRKQSPYSRVLFLLRQQFCFNTYTIQYYFVVQLFFVYGRSRANSLYMIRLFILFQKNIFFFMFDGEKKHIFQHHPDPFVALWNMIWTFADSTEKQQQQQNVEGIVSFVCIHATKQMIFSICYMDLENLSCMANCRYINVWLCRWFFYETEHLCCKCGVSSIPLMRRFFQFLPKLLTHCIMSRIKCLIQDSFLWVMKIHTVYRIFYPHKNQ